MTRAPEEFSPHAWGWSARWAPNHPNLDVLPTRVGMVRTDRSCPRCGRRSPHTRGDGPFSDETFRRTYLFSPHAWGWSELVLGHRQDTGVLPTRVGMVRSIQPPTRSLSGSPHTRGDGPMHCPETCVLGQRRSLLTRERKIRDLRGGGEQGFWASAIVATAGHTKEAVRMRWARLEH
jgi:hypothetical protein